MANYYSILPNLTCPIHLSNPLDYPNSSPHMDASNPPDKAFGAV